MAALVVMGAVVVSCSKKEIDQPNEETTEVVEPAAEDNIVVCTTTVSFGTDGTKALDEDGVKTFAPGEKIAVIYKNNSDQTVKAESDPLPDGDYGKTATFTVALTDPKSDAAVRIIYPAAMAASTVDADVAVNAEATINYAALNSQDGTLASISSDLDLAVYDGTLSGTVLPTDPALHNQLAICLYTIKDNATPTANDLTSTITGMTISDGTYNYSVSRSAAAGPIYVAIRPTSDATINYTATDGTNYFKKTVTGKTYGASQMYPLGLRMSDYGGVNLSTIGANYVAQHGDVLTGTLTGNYKISIADGATVTLAGIIINGGDDWDTDWAGITCEGDATLVLADGTSNSVKPFRSQRAAISVPSGKTLSIQGSGSLTAEARENWGTGAGIGGDDLSDYGNIVITGAANVTAYGGGAGIGGGSSNGYLVAGGNITISTTGTVTAYGGEHSAGIGSGRANDADNSCGDILISKGTVVATGGNSAAGIGSGLSVSSATSRCGTITIENTVTSVTATKGGDAYDCIGRGDNGTCGTVKFGDQTMFNGSSWTTTPTAGGTYGGLSLAITTTTNTNDTWTLTPYVAPAVPTGAIDGLFTVSNDGGLTTKQVYFSQGNLQAIGTTSSSPSSGWTWQFAEHQWDYIGGLSSSSGSEAQTGNNYISDNGTVSSNGTVDLFCWSTNATYYGIHNSYDNNDYSGDFRDWGNTMSGNWRTLTYAEWGYLFNTRTTTSGVRYAKAKVNNVNGVILLPDDWSTSYHALSSTDTGNAAFTANEIDASTWASSLEAHGAVFLPAAGCRYIDGENNNYATATELAGFYWSSVRYDDGYYNDKAYNFFFNPELVEASYSTKNGGCSVRLVKDAN